MIMSIFRIFSLFTKWENWTWFEGALSTLLLCFFSIIGFWNITNLSVPSHIRIGRSWNSVQFMTLEEMKTPSSIKKRWNTVQGQTTCSGGSNFLVYCAVASLKFKHGFSFVFFFSFLPSSCIFIYLFSQTGGTSRIPS